MGRGGSLCRGVTRWDSFYDEGGVGFVGVVWASEDFEAVGYSGRLDWDGRTDRWWDREWCTSVWTEGIVGVGWSQRLDIDGEKILPSISPVGEITAGAMP